LLPRAQVPVSSFTQVNLALLGYPDLALLMATSLVNDNAEILPAEEYTYALMDPGVFQGVEGYSYGRVLVLALEDEGSNQVQVTLVRSGLGHILQGD